MTNQDADIQAPRGAAAEVHAAEAVPSQATPKEEKPPLDEQQTAALVEAILFSTDAPLTPEKIAQVAEIPRKAVRAAIEALNARYEQLGCTFRIEGIAGGFQMHTLPQYHDVVSRLLKVRGDAKLSQAALESLAIIAYRQPMLRADMEAIRGVSCGEVLRGLMERQLVKIVGRAEVLGRPMLYGTTKRFLEVFGLNSLEDLPKVEELRSGARTAKPKDAAPAPQAAANDAAAPQAAETSAPQEPPAAEDAPAPQEPPAAEDAPAPQEPPAPAETPALTEDHT